MYKLWAADKVCRDASGSSSVMLGLSAGNWWRPYRHKVPLAFFFFFILFSRYSWVEVGLVRGIKAAVWVLNTTADSYLTDSLKWNRSQEELRASLCVFSARGCESSGGLRSVGSTQWQKGEVGWRASHLDEETTWKKQNKEADLC